MKNFTLDEVKKLCKQSLKEEPTGNAWLDSRYNEQVHFVGHTQPYYRAFYLIAQALKPTLSVELGSWQGTAAAHLACGYPNGRVITIDIHREDKDAQKRTIEVMQKCRNVAYINAWTIPGFAPNWNTVKQIEAYGKPIDILFVDAWHEGQYATKERDLYFPLLADTALVICDDISSQGNTMPGMDEFWAETKKGYETFVDTDIHKGVPMGFIKYERIVADDRKIDRAIAATDTERIPRKSRRKPRTS